MLWLFLIAIWRGNVLTSALSATGMAPNAFLVSEYLGKTRAAVHDEMHLQVLRRSLLRMIARLFQKTLTGNFATLKSVSEYVIHKRSFFFFSQESIQ